MEDADQGHTMTIGQAAEQALTAAAASQEQSMKGSQTSSEAVHKRHFLQTFRRWEILFKRKDGDTEADKWLIAEYYDSLRHLSEAGMDALTRQLKESCTFFPSIKECLDLTRPASRYDWAHPFLNKPELHRAAPRNPQLASPPIAIAYDSEG